MARFARKTPVIVQLRSNPQRAGARLAACAALAATLGAQRAAASGFSVARFAAEHGHPTTDNATAIYFNPAALTLAPSPRLFGDLTIALRRATYTRPPQPSDAPEPPDAVGANTGRASLENVLVGPALGVVVPSGELAFGLGWFTPFGAPVSWDRRAAFADHPRLPGPADGVQRWHSIEGHLYTSYLALAVARSFLDQRLALGVAVNLLGSSIEDVRARGDGTNDVEHEGRALLEAKGLAFSVGLGASYEAVAERLWIGVSYQSRPNLSGGMILHGTAEGNLGTTSRADVDVTYDLPDVIRAGVRFRPEPWLELRVFGDYTRYSAFERQCVRFSGGECRLAPDGSQLPGSAVLQNLPREFRDSAGLRVGVSVHSAAGVEVFSGMGVESSAVPDATLEAALPDFASVSFAVGARATIARGVRAAVSATELLFVPRDVQSRLARYATPSKQPDASGHYTQFVTALNANVEYAF